MNELQAQRLLKPYPLFRLTLFLVTGIFLSLVGRSEELPDWMVWMFAALLVGCLMGMMLCLRTSRFSFRFAYGVLAFSGVGMLGALLGEGRIREVRYDWPLIPGIYRGTLLESPQEKAKTFLCRLRVDDCWTGDSLLWEASSFDKKRSVAVNREVWAYVMKDSLSDRLVVGDRLCFYAQVERPRSSELPGEFDYANYLFRKGVSGTAVVFAGSWKRLDRHEPLTWKQKALRCREKVLETYQRWGFRGDELAVLSALTVGYKDDLSEEVQATYRVAGVSHILALSGMHVAVLWGLLAFLLRPLDKYRWGRWMKCVLVVGLLWTFAFLVGLSASVVRAVVMCTLFLLAKTTSAEQSSLNSLSIAAAGMLCYDPFYLFDVGFQLSFLAVFSILMIYPLIFHCWHVHARLLRYVWGIVSVSLAAQLGTSPLVLYYFSHFPVYFLLANLWVAPCVCLIVYGTVLLWLVSPFELLRNGMVFLLDALLKLMNAGLHQLGAFPHSESVSIHLSPWLMAALYGLLACVWMGVVYRSRKMWIPLLLTLHLIVALSFFPVGTSEMHEGVYLSEGQVRAVPKNAVWQCDSLYRYRGMTICLVASDRWKGMQSSSPLQVDYLYLCRGYHGKIAFLQRLFRIRKVVLDSSVSVYQRSRYEKECRELGLDFIVLERKGSCWIIP